ncbi:hypothetical protein B0T25DRAFT_545185 [Lasiosphaeria hispida]|uniref:Uncharacterized protein n=1 Tax=Lasiosphaeria hispida TaxID=260671 RepID=A0AAJ0MEZ1_9PEZI|nr:hypothetical protein B0T25DRAFT_545185 [Lasiosphaeria hispida]
MVIRRHSNNTTTQQALNLKEKNNYLKWSPRLLSPFVINSLLSATNFSLLTNSPRLGPKMYMVFFPPPWLRSAVRILTTLPFFFFLRLSMALTRSPLPNRAGSWRRQDPVSSSLRWWL